VYRVTRIKQSFQMQSGNYLFLKANYVYNKDITWSEHAVCGCDLLSQLTPASFLWLHEAPHCGLHSRMSVSRPWQLRLFSAKSPVPCPKCEPVNALAIPLVKVHSVKSITNHGGNQRQLLLIIVQKRKRQTNNWVKFKTWLTTNDSVRNTCYLNVIKKLI